MVIIEAKPVAITRNGAVVVLKVVILNLSDAIALMQIS
jgi:hypothetical protein